FPGFAVIAGGVLPDRGHDVLKAHGVGVKHRPAAIHGEAVAGDVDHVDVDGALRDSFLDDARAFVDEGVDTALDDLGVGNRAARDADPRGVLDDQLRHGWIRHRRPASGLVLIEARAGLLTEATELADTVGDFRIDEVGTLDVAALADVPADVVAGE